MRTWRPGLCVLCGKRRAHADHRGPAELTWWQRVLRLAWPRWMWVRGPRCPYLGADARVAAAETMANVRRRFDRAARRRS